MVSVMSLASSLEFEFKIIKLLGRGRHQRQVARVQLELELEPEQPESRLTSTPGVEEPEHPGASSCADQIRAPESRLLDKRTGARAGLAANEPIQAWLLII
jgi:hypothetical protein